VTDTLHDTFSERIAAGERLGREEMEQLAATHDILSVGMLADEARRLVHGTRVTFVRVASCPFDRPLTDIPPAASEVRLTGTPPSLEAALAAVQTVKPSSDGRMVSGFSLVDLVALAERAGVAPRVALEHLRGAGLDSIAECPLEHVTAEALEAAVAAGFERLRLTVSKASPDAALMLLLKAAELGERFVAIETINPLSMVLETFRKTTGYEDVRMVALCRLAVPAIPHVQVDWQRYGPKLAQVALTFGADDIDHVSPSDEAPDGRRRAVLEEVRRNVEAAGFTPVQRDGYFQAT
jgi:aminodeoxyfutalosine synthase